jgi:hypothetical protein
MNKVVVMEFNDKLNLKNAIAHLLMLVDDPAFIDDIFTMCRIRKGALVKLHEEALSNGIQDDKKIMHDIAVHESGYSKYKKS